MIDYNDLEQFLSEERLDKYLVLADNNKKEAIRLYELNLKYSANLYMVLSCFEIVLRNLINREMLKYNADWILNLSSIDNKIISNLSKMKQLNIDTVAYYNKFFKEQEKLINDAKKSLEDDNKDIDNNYLISRLNFGFWTRMFNKCYETEIWNKYLYKIFKKQTRRGYIEAKLNELRRLRNRVAHNECVLNLRHKPIEYFDLIIELLNNTDVKIIDWINKQVSRDLFK